MPKCNNTAKPKKKPLPPEELEQLTDAAIILNQIQGNWQTVS